MKLIRGSMIAPEAGELIQEMQLAQYAGITIRKITSRVYPYPVSARINQKTLRRVMVHTYSDFKKKLARMPYHLVHLLIRIPLLVL
jgi:hypothetical protein